jgi:pyruvate ferredoxin oxidoreductase beta subunit/2-oxoisovalerate ferredoxin oxidoreductase beta subunit
MSGFRFLQMLAPCPTCWKSEPADGIALVRLAVSSGLFAVYEVFDGVRTKINVEPDLSREALEAYVAAQGRFRKGSVDVAAVAAEIKRSWRRLKRREREEASDEDNAGAPA